MKLSTFVGVMMLAISTGAVCDDEDFRVSNTIHSEKSLYRNILIISSDSHICMTFGRRQGMQSCALKNDPDYLVLNYTKGLMASLFIVPNPKRVLVIGMGGGSLSKALRKYDPDLYIDTVELDPSVVSVAQQFFKFSSDPRSSVHVSDGRMFVRQQLKKGVSYDIILVDAFDKDYIPEHMLTVEYLRQVKAILAPGGVVATNTFTSGPLASSEMATYKAAFGTIVRIGLRGGNSVIFSSDAGHQRLAATHEPEVISRLAALGVHADILDGLHKGQVAREGDEGQIFTDQHSPANLMLNQ